MEEELSVHRALNLAVVHKLTILRSRSAVEEQLSVHRALNPAVVHKLSILHSRSAVMVVCVDRE